MRSVWLAVAISVSRVPAASAQPPGAAPLQISIEDAMRAAARVSHPVAAARATIERARADVAAARAGYLPQIAASASYVRTLESEYEGLFEGLGPGLGGDMGDPLVELPFGREHAWRAGIDVTQSVWDGGRTRSSVALARSARTLAELDERGRRAVAVLEVTEAYYGAVLAEELVAIGEASLSLAERTLANAQLGFEQGSTSEFDRVRAEVTRDNQRTSLVRARADRDLALVRLRRLLGLPLARPLALPSRLDGGGGAGAPARTAGAIAGGGPERLPVAQARATADARQAQLDQARAERWPQIGLFTSLGVVSYPRQIAPEAWRRNGTVGVSVTVPLFTGFRTTAQIRGARADRRAAEALLAEAAAQTAEADVRARSDVGVASATLAASARSTGLARRAYEIAEVRYQQGVSTYLELADARLALDQAQINQASAARDLQVARVRAVLLPSLPLATVSPAPSTAATLAVTPGASATPRTPQAA
ncbi:MAG TPA: TolC family protein, partial [Kofleriaceae bacterium]|nr:TolC family protein [Kofleriaceae bacterium]